MLKALKSGKYDLDKTAVLITQTGGGCRATNYIGFIRKALKNAGMEQIPVVSVSAQGLEKKSGFKYNPANAQQNGSGTCIRRFVHACSLQNKTL